MLKNRINANLSDNWYDFNLSKKNCTQKGAFSIQFVSEFTPSTKNLHFFAYKCIRIAYIFLCWV